MTTTARPKKEKTFEEAMDRLEQIVSEIESDGLGLERQFELFQEGMALARFCDGKLTDVEKSVEIVLKESAEEWKTAPFETGEPESAARGAPIRTMAMATTAADVAGYLSSRRQDVDRELARLIPAETAWPERLHRAIRHSLFAGGKRLRPILCLAAGETAGAPAGRLLAPACGLEMIHTYSLIHDDLPALDDDDLRRGVPTCHVAFGEATAILAGDALLTHGLGTLAAHPEGGEFAAAKIRVLETVVDAIGTRGMIGGQVADLEAEQRTDSSEDLVLSIHENKTGRLIRASLAVGGILSGATRDVIRALDTYGRAVGLAFQIKDDLLGRRGGRGHPRQERGQGRRRRQGDVSGDLGRRAIAREALRAGRAGDRGRPVSSGPRRTAPGSGALRGGTEEVAVGRRLSAILAPAPCARSSRRRSAGSRSGTSRFRTPAPGRRSFACARR